MAQELEFLSSGEEQEESECFPGPSKKRKEFSIRKYQGAATYKTKFKCTHS